MAGTTWDTVNKNAAITLSANNLQASQEGATGAWRSVLASTSKSSGKWYFEFTISAYDFGTGIIIGMGNISANLAAFAGNDGNSFGMQATGSNHYNLSPNGFASDVGFTWGTVIGFAVDIDNKRVWFKAAGGSIGNWNNNATNDPTAPSGYFSYTCTGAMFPMFSGFNATSNGDSAKINTGQYTWVIGPPSGFSAWDTNDPATSIIGGVSPTVWSASDKNSNISLPGISALAATNLATASHCGIRATTRRDRGKYYFEILCATVGGNTIIGFGNASASLNNYVGQDSHGASKNNGDGSIYFAGTNRFGGPTFTNNDILGFALDFDHGLWWVTKSGGNWNNNAAYGPSTLLGGYGIPSVGPWYPMVSLNYATVESTSFINAGEFPFILPMPVGYSEWDTTILTTPVGGGTQPTTWDATHADAAITLSNGNLTAASTSATWKSVRSTSYKSVGKYYFEVECTVSNMYWIVGLGNASAPTNTNVGNDKNGLAYNTNNGSPFVLINATTLYGWASITANHWVGVAVDFNHGLVWLRTDTNGNWNNDVTASPVTGLGGYGLAMGTDLYIWFSGQTGGGNPTAVLKTNNVGLTMSVPSGYSTWDDAIPYTIPSSRSIRRLVIR